MRRRFALALAALMAAHAPDSIPGALAQAGALPCDAFQKNADGSWTVLSTTFIEDLQAKVQEGAILPPGYTVRGYDIPANLARACPNAPAGTSTSTSTSAAAPSPLQPPQPASPSQFPLSRYADANGNIDVGRLTCAQVNQTPGDETALLLAWYSGSYNAVATKRAANAINVARLRYTIGNVVDFCKANRDKKLMQVMELMLK